MTQESTQLQTVVVTGASGALGASVAERFLAEDCTVVGVDIGLEQGPELVGDARRDSLHWIDIDLSSAQAVREGFERIEAAFDGIDALVNCAGGFRWTPIGEASDEDVDFLIDANLRSALHVVRQVVPGMTRRDFGRIVLISSRSTLGPSAGEGPYAATKAALNGLTKAVADEVKATDVTINAVMPSVIDTPANRQDMPEADHHAWVGRDQLADIIYLLTQPVSRPINGALIPVSGRT